METKKIKSLEDNETYMLATDVAKHIGISEILMRKRIARDKKYKALKLQGGYYVKVDKNNQPSLLKDDSKHIKKTKEHSNKLPEKE